MNEYIRASVRRLTPYTPGEQPRLDNLVKLNTNENPYPPSPQVAAFLSAFALERLRLYPDPLAEALRSRIAAMHGCDSENIIAGNGSDELLTLCTRAFVESDGGSIGYFEPSYSLYPVLADIRGVERRPVELTRDFAWRMPAEYNASLFFLANPNAPTGMLFDKVTIRQFCRRFKGVVVLDEAYGDFAREHCIDLALEEPNVLVMRTFSKSFSLAGARVGYVVGSPRLVEALFKLKDSYNLNMLSQGIALAALEDLPWMQANVARIIATRQRLSVELARLGFSVAPSETNFVWTRPPVIVTAEALFDRLRHRAIVVRHFPGAVTGGFLRITIGTDAQIDRLLDALRKELQ